MTHAPTHAPTHTPPLAPARVVTDAVSSGRPAVAPHASPGGGRSEPAAVHADELPLHAPRPGPLVVAFDHHSLAAGALRLAKRLARRDGVRVHVVSALAPVRLRPGTLHPDDARALQYGRLSLHRAQLRQQVQQLVGRSARFSTSVAVATSVRAYTATAHERGAAYVLAGLDDPGAPGRVANERAILQIARLADTPVLAVPRSCTRVPTRAVVALNGSAGSVRSARAVARLLPPGATLTLACVMPAYDGAQSRRAHVHPLMQADILERIAAVASELQALAVLTVETVWLEGDPAAAVLAFAASRNAGLVACGLSDDVTHDDGRLATGVPAELLRGARQVTLLARSRETS